MKDLIEVLRFQRHDFANHLQIISGLLQLKKYDRAYEYIKQIGHEFNQAGIVGRIEVPEITQVVLTAELTANVRGIKIKNRIGTCMEKGVHSAPVVADLVRKLLESAIQLTEIPDDSKGQINFSIDEIKGYYVFCAGFFGSGSKQNLALTTRKIFLEEQAAKVSGYLEEKVSSHGEIILRLKVPVKEDEYISLAAETEVGYR